VEPIRYIAKVLPDGHLPLPDAVRNQTGNVFDVILMPLSPGTEVYNRIEEIVAARKIINHSLDEVAELVATFRGQDK
jgi:hypothetical protein